MGDASHMSVDAQRAELDGQARETRLLRQRDALIRLNGKENVLGDDLCIALRRIAAEDAKAIDVCRVSIWEFSPDGTELRCVALCENGVAKESSDMVLSSSLYPNYFRALEETDVIAANDAATDPRSAEFAESYLRPSGITSMMDAPVRLHGAARGIVCHEHIGPARRWTSDEQTFAVAIANLVALVLEVSERQRTEEALRLSEERFRTAIVAAPFPVMLHAEGGEILFVNDVLTSITGHRLEDIPTIDAWTEKAYGHDKERVRSIIAGLYEIGDQCEEGTFDVFTRDGDTRAWVWRSAPLGKLSDGRRLIISMATDITERHRAEMKLRTSESILRSFYESCPLMMGVVELTESGTVADVYSNPAAANMQGGPPPLASGADSAKGIAGLWATNFRRSQLQGSAVHFEYMHPTPQGARRVSATVSPVEASTNKRAQFSYVAEDVTDHMRLEERLRHAQKMEAIGTLASGIAHDFNNMLASIIGYTELVQSDLDEGSLGRQDLDMALTAANRGKELVHQMLTFSRQVEEERNPEDLGPIIRDVVRAVGSAMPATIAFQVLVADETAPVLADASQLHSAITHLCTNAYHAMENSGGTIRIEVENRTIDSTHLSELHDLTEGPYVRLAVTDTGCGMDPRTQKRAFEPFFTTKPQGKGTGLGLSMVHGIVTSHGGSISLESTLGAGTTATIYLPARTFPPQAEPAGLSPGFGCHENILVVDDEKSLAHLMKRTLSGFGYNVVALTSSTEALAAVAGQPDFFELVIADKSMPAMTGPQLAAELHKLQPRLPVIIVTGSDPSDVELPAEIAATVTKPMRMDELTRVVRSVLDRPASRWPAPGTP
jgi:PAS domain S-box-containing protein